MGTEDSDEKLTKIARETLHGQDFEAADFRTRLSEEFSQLRDRLNKLEAFMTTTQFNDLPDIERAALQEQYGHMRAYYTVLSGRVSRLCGDA